MKKLVIYIGHHQPVGERWVEESLVEGLLKTGECVSPEEFEKIKDYEHLVKDGLSDAEARGTAWSEEPIVEVPSEKWTEKKIKAWIDERNIPIEYNIKRDTKKKILGRLKDLGHL